MIEIKYGTVTQINPMRIKLDGEIGASNITYKRNASYIPTLEDRVYLLISNSVYIVQGKII